MTVNELITQLDLLPADAEVVLGDQQEALLDVVLREDGAVVVLR
jgi:hypothetical protein